ncbi:hypothetical protein HC823_00095 [Candidatus Gracilibacteria bacterium]|nr:hypothetical protein [Candidatus Gracilibacteria bacterium]
MDNSSSTPEESSTIKIGGLGALTGEGAPYGIMVQKVSNLRIKQFNEAGGGDGKR